MPKQKSELSLIEIAQQLVETNDGPIAIMELINKSLKMKGLEPSVDKKAQLLQDIMVNGLFVSKADAKGNQLIDLKSRQSASFLDKDDTIEDYLENDDEVKKNELREGMELNGEEGNALDQMNQDEIEEEGKEETDEIAEELGLVDADLTDEDEIIIDAEDEEEDEEEITDLDDISGEIKIYNRQ